MTVVQPDAPNGTGTVFIWGDNGFGQQCDGTNDPRLLPGQIDGLENVITVVAGGGHVATLLADRTVLGWGRNEYGQAGNGAFEHTNKPAKIAGLEDVALLVGGGGHTLALAPDGTVWGWGHNGRGDLGDGTSENRPYPVKVKGLTNVATLAWGGGHGVALDNDGVVWTWGHNIVGQCGDGTSVSRLEPVRPAIEDAVEIGGGGGHTMVKKADGSLWAWGRNDRGQVGDGTFETRFEPVRVVGLDDVDIAYFGAGYFHSVLLTTDGTVYTWGNNDSGQLGDGGTENSAVPAKVEGLTGVKAIVGGGGRNEWGPGGHCLALLEDNTVVAWGLNDAGQLGDGTTENRAHPVEVKGLTDVVALAAGGGYSLALV
jgi:alpha-tubulin suppressor-like RCC1 family protein